MYMPPRWISPVLFAPGVIWEAALRARNSLFESGALTSRTLPRPVISIGNLTLGGTGKTPLAIYVARLLVQIAATPVLLSRGYARGAGHRCSIVPPDLPIALPARELGDEPALVRRSVPEAWLGISADRYEAGGRIAKRVPGAVFILDDGFQHRKLRRDLDLLIVDSTQPLEKNRVFPRGSLREPIEGMRRCHAVLINGAGGTEAPLEEIVRGIHPRARVFHCQQRIETILPYAEWLRTSPVPVSVPTPAFLVAAIGNPRRFERDVAALALEIRGSRFYSDHFALRLDDWRACWEEARATGAQCLLTTEKDAIKVPGDPGVPLMVAVQSTHVSETDAFREMIRHAATG